MIYESDPCSENNLWGAPYKQKKKLDTYKYIY